MQLFDFIIRIYHDARSRERKILEFCSVSQTQQFVHS
jgi:hypothetical protein